METFPVLEQTATWVAACEVIKHRPERSVVTRFCDYENISFMCMNGYREGGWEKACGQTHKMPRS